MNLEKLIKMLMEQGKTDDEIAKSVIESDEQGVKEEVEGEDVEAVVEKTLKKIEFLRSYAKINEQRAKNKADLEKKKADQDAIGKVVDEKLKSINIDPTGKFRDTATYKKFDFQSGKMVDVCKSDTSEAYREFAKMLCAHTMKDKASAHAISREIEQDNAKKLALDVKATLRTDSSSVGGYAIPTEVESEIAQLSYSQSVMLPLVNRDGIIHNSKLYPTIGDVTVSYIANEDAQLTESNPTMSNPTADMKRFGCRTNVANELITQSNIVAALQTAYASARARFFDAEIAIGNISGASNPIDGLVWQGSVAGLSPVVKANLTISDLMTMTETMDDEVDWSRVAWIGNTKIRNLVGNFESTGGSKVFPQFMGGGDFSPLGYKFVQNSKITSVLQVAEDDRTGGTDDVLLLADMSKVVVGIDSGMRIDASEHIRFDYDQTQFRILERWAMVVLFADAVQVLELN